ncbi:MAG: site-specific integrase [Opitutaceae bacterium]|nr:site-specific integrase [Opitutaceae bacterium]
MDHNLSGPTPVDLKIGNREATGEATGQQPEATKRKHHECGVRTFEHVGKPSPFGVQWRVDGQRKTEFFTNETDRDRRAGALRKERRSNTLALVPARDELADWHAFKAAIGGTNWRDVVAAWKKGGGSEVSVTVSEIVERFLLEQDERLTAGTLASVTHKKNCPKAKAFAADFGPFQVRAVEASDIEEWIDDLGFEAAETFNTYRKVIHSVFEHAKKECPVNPVSGVKSRDDKGEIEILTVDETDQLLKYALKHYRDIVPRLALECFAGLRFSSAFRLTREDINFDDKGIHLPAHKLKTGRRHYIDGLPENLWAWLKLENPATWSMTPRNYRRLKSECFSKSGVRHPANCLRHNFCTYHVAAFKDPGKTATILCHQNQGMLWAHYNGRAKQADGKRYFMLRPAR